MSMNEMQFRFVHMVALLILYAEARGYTLTFGDAYATSGHCDNSYHYLRLAIDLNLFKNGEYLTETKDHEPLGVFWEALGGTWGGRWEDGNHYSLGEDSSWRKTY